MEQMLNIFFIRYILELKNKIVRKIFCIDGIVNKINIETFR